MCVLDAILLNFMQDIWFESENLNKMIYSLLLYLLVCVTFFMILIGRFWPSSLPHKLNLAKTRKSSYHLLVVGCVQDYFLPPRPGISGRKSRWRVFKHACPSLSGVRSRRCAVRLNNCNGHCSYKGLILTKRHKRLHSVTGNNKPTVRKPLNKG
jgi:hypothetical protein